MSSVPARKTVSPPRHRVEKVTEVRPSGPSLRAVTPPPELYPSLIEAIRIVWRNRGDRLASRAIAARGRDTGVRL